MKCPITCRRATGAGWMAFTIELFGAYVSNGNNEAALLGIFGAIAHLSAKQV